MFYALTKLFEGKNINQKMTLRNQLKNVKIQNAETIQSYFTRIYQIKKKLEAVDEEVENAEIVMTALNRDFAWVICHVPNFALGHNGLITFSIFMRVCQINAKGQIIVEENY